MSIFFAKILLILCLSLLACALVLVVCNIFSGWELGSPKVENAGFIRQSGDYWVWHNYITADEDLIGNESITLATHATYADLSLLPSSLSRWQAPISLAIFACGDDFEKLINSLSYINSCLAVGELLRRFVTIHLVIHQDHLPDSLRRVRLPVTGNKGQCQQPPVFANATQKQSHWHRNKLRYPVNLLRNVARLNVRTYYVLSLDIQLAPPPNFDQRFLKFAWQTNVPEPYTTLYCLPTFPHKKETPLPETKSQLLKDLKASELTQLEGKKLKEWMDAPNPQEELLIYSSSKNMEMCVAYVSVNELEPLYDEDNEDESIFEQGTNLKGQVLIDLKYTFLVLDGAFLIRRSSDSWRNTDPIRPKKFWNNTGRSKYWRRWHSWHQFYSKVIRYVASVLGIIVTGIMVLTNSLVPEEFSQEWFSRSRKSLYLQTML